jgi:hypothetical protein
MSACAICAPAWSAPLCNDSVYVFPFIPLPSLSSLSSPSSCLTLSHHERLPITLFFSPGLSRPRLPKLRGLPRADRPSRDHSRLYFACLRRADHHGSAHKILGGQVAETGGACARGVCGQGGWRATEGDHKRVGRGGGQVYTEGWEGCG